jgi:hypothetical protein
MTKYVIIVNHFQERKMKKNGIATFIKRETSLNMWLQSNLNFAHQKNWNMAWNISNVLAHMFLSHVYLIPCTSFCYLNLKFEIHAICFFFSLWFCLIEFQFSYSFYFFACCYVCWLFLVICSLITPWVVNYFVFFSNTPMSSIDLIGSTFNYFILISY